MRFKQLPLTGDQEDFYKSYEMLKGVSDVGNAIYNFYNKNKEYNPRQLHYIIETLSNETHLDFLLDLKEGEIK